MREILQVFQFLSILLFVDKNEVSCVSMMDHENTFLLNTQRFLISLEIEENDNLSCLFRHLSGIAHIPSPNAILRKRRFLSRPLSILPLKEDKRVAGGIVRSYTFNLGINQGRGGGCP